jgi:hypothetical protein
MANPINKNEQAAGSGAAKRPQQGHLSGEELVWHMLGIVIYAALIYPFIALLKVLKSVVRAHAFKRDADAATELDQQAAYSATQALSQAADQEEPPILLPPVAKELVLPTRAADVSRSIQLSNRQTLSVWLYFAEQVIAQTLVTRLDDGVQRRRLPLVELNQNMHTDDILKGLASKYMRECVDASINDVEVTNAPPATLAEVEVTEMPSEAAVAPQESYEEPEMHDGQFEGIDDLPVVTANLVESSEQSSRGIKREFTPSKEAKPLQSFRGRFEDAGMYERQGTNGPYQHFGVQIMSSDGVLETAYGVDLRRCLKSSGAEPGDLILVEQMREAGSAGSGNGRKVWSMTVLQSARS